MLLNLVCIEFHRTLAALFDRLIYRGLGGGGVVNVRDVRGIHDFLVGASIAECRTVEFGSLHPRRNLLLFILSRADTTHNKFCKAKLDMNLRGSVNGARGDSPGRNLHPAAIDRALHLERFHGGRSPVHLVQFLPLAVV